MTEEQLEQNRKLVAALRSGDYTQTRGQLAKEDETGKLCFCCLGVATVICEPTYFDLPSNCAKAYPPFRIVEKYGWDRENPYLGNYSGVSADYYNDGNKYTFAQIADLFEARYVTPYEKAAQ